MIDQHYRVSEVAKMTGLSIFTIRRRIKNREIGYTKGKRVITIPEAEVRKLIGEFRAPLSPNLKGSVA